MMAYQKAKGLLREWDKKCKNKYRTNTHHDKRDNKTLHNERPKTTALHGSNTWQHSMVATKHDNMVATQHGSSTKHGTLLGKDNSTKGKKVETTTHHAKQSQLSVRVSMIVFEWRDWDKTVQFECLMQPVSLAEAIWKDERPRDVCAFRTFNRMWLAEQVLYV